MDEVFLTTTRVKLCNLGVRAIHLDYERMYYEEKTCCSACYGADVDNRQVPCLTLDLLGVGQGT